MSLPTPGLKPALAGEPPSDPSLPTLHLTASAGTTLSHNPGGTHAAILAAMHHLHWMLSKAEASLPRGVVSPELDRHRERELIGSVLQTATALEAQCVRLVRHGQRSLIRIRIDERESDLAACSSRLMKTLHDALLRMAGVDAAAAAGRSASCHGVPLAWPQEEDLNDDEDELPSTEAGTLYAHEPDAGTETPAERTSPVGAGHVWGAMTTSGFSLPCRLQLSALPMAADGLCIRLDFPVLPSTVRQLDQIGLEPDDQARIERALWRAGGLVLVGGPARSGRSSTLYAMVSRLDARGRSIQTIETPPLRYMPGWLQLSPDQPDPSDLTALLASNLADVALVDLPFSESTLDACLQLGQTGCLVLAPVNLARAHHAFSLATRSLTNPFGKHLSLVMVQRLARRLCSQCARPDHSPDMRAILARAANAGLIHHAMTPACASPRGCPACRGTGYAGRVMIYELLEVDSAIQSILDDGAPASQIEQRLVADGRSLWDQAVRLLARGSTSLDAVREVIREP